MATVVGGFIMPHDPLIFAAPEAAGEAQRASVMAAFDYIRKRISELSPTTVIIAGDDHYEHFGPSCLPPYLIGTGDVFFESPTAILDSSAATPLQKIEGNGELALHIVESCAESGFDWAVAKCCCLDHSIGIPYGTVVAPNPGIRLIPVYLAAAVAPLVRIRRAHALGLAVQAAIRSWAGEERVVVIGSGGLSHWPVEGSAGRVSSNFDEFLLKCICAGDLEPILDLSDAEILEEAGSGALEVRNHLFALGVASLGRTLVIAYEPVEEWVTGLGFAEIRLD